MGAAAAELSMQLNHYEMLEGDKLTSYVVVQVCATLTCYRMYNTRRECEEEEEEERSLIKDLERHARRDVGSSDELLEVPLRM